MIEEQGIMDKVQKIETFESIIKDLESEWNLNQYLTCEFSTSEYNMLEKVMAMQASDRRLTNGRWTISYCETCKGYNESTPYHVQIERCLTDEELHKFQNENYHLRQVTKKFNVHGNVSIPTETLKDLISEIEKNSDEPCKIDVYSEATCLLDEAIEDNNKLKIAD